MKNLILFLAVFVATLSSCEGPQGPPGPQGPTGTSLESEVIQLNGVNFNAGGNYGIFYDLVPAILSSDMVLVYRQSGTDGGNPVWQLIPKTYYIEEGEIDFNFDFTVNDVNIYIESTYDPLLTPEFINNQSFRIVIIPGYFSNRASFDFNDYDATVRALGLENSTVRQVEF